MRVAIFTDTYAPQVNGVAMTIKRLANKLEDVGIAHRVFTVQCEGARSDMQFEKRFPGIAFWGDTQLTLSLPSLREARSELAQWKPSLVHVTTPFGVGMAGLRAAKSLEIPIVTSYHTRLAEYARFYGLGALSEAGWKFLRWFHNSGRRTYCPTQSVCDQLEVRGFKNLEVWSRGVDSNRFNPKWRSLEMRAELGAGHDSIVVAYVGRIAKEKGLEDACVAMRKAGAENPRLVFVFAGDGPYLAECKRAAPPRSHFLGALTGDRLSRLYASSDIFVFPSVTDTFGNVLLEAMASGIHVVAADSAPTREITEGTGARIVAAGAPYPMAAAINELASCQAERSERAHLGLESARRRSWDTVFAELLISYSAAVLQ